MIMEPAIAALVATVPCERLSDNGWYAAIRCLAAPIWRVIVPSILVPVLSGERFAVVGWVLPPSGYLLNFPE